jgi:methionyl-tRNA formyltransferase
MLSKEMSPIDWNRSAREIDCQVRGLIPWPCATTELAGTRFKVYRTVPGSKTDKAPGTILCAGKKGIEVACGDGKSLLITELQAEGGKRMAAGAYLLGHPIQI